MTTITEADVEEASLAWLADLGWGVAHGPDIAPETPNAERDDYGQVVLEYGGCGTPSPNLILACPSMRWTTPTAS